MVYRFLMLSEENDFFRREIQIDSEATFAELNDFILDHLGYGRQEMTTFHICDDEWNKLQEVTLLDMGMSSEYDLYLMENTRLEELLEDKGQRLIFIFDMLSERGFFIELAELIPGKQLDKPVVTLAEGAAPKQTSSLEDAEKRSVGTTTDSLGLEDSELFSTELDLDDLDPEGFGELLEDI